jgi:hypothetical protein
VEGDVLRRQEDFNIDLAKKFFVRDIRNTFGDMKNSLGYIDISKKDFLKRYKDLLIKIFIRDIRDMKKH